MEVVFSGNNYKLSTSIKPRLPSFIFFSCPSFRDSPRSDNIPHPTTPLTPSKAASLYVIYIIILRVYVKKNCINLYINLLGILKNLDKSKRHTHFRLNIQCVVDSMRCKISLSDHEYITSAKTKINIVVK